MISVIIATRNRSQDLRETLGSLVSQKLPKQEFEVIVVNNGSNDNTQEVVSQFYTLGNVLHVFEPVAGLSQARNTGVKASHGDILAFIDDDAIADENWLLELTKIYQETAAIGVGGAIKGLWLCPRPRWFHPDLDILLSLLDLGKYRREFSLPSNAPVGTNMSFRREVFERYGIFNTALGRGSSKISGGEETELFTKIVSDNQLVLYCPDLIVFHKVTPAKVRFSSLCKLAYEQGRIASFFSRRDGSWSRYFKLSDQSLFSVLMQLRKIFGKADPESTSGSALPQNDIQIRWLGKLFWIIMKSLMAIGYAREYIFALIKGQQGN
jgi:glycosyltransferase involved in cell wall biosynthesis